MSDDPKFLRSTDPNRVPLEVNEATMPWSPECSCGALVEMMDDLDVVIHGWHDRSGNLSVGDALACIQGDGGLEILDELHAEALALNDPPDSP